ncbi:imidazole glycerol phosphate synthase subunit HisH [Caldalkalibacillus mannanilyticus]|uniref:imidazole glycerol phosphate synthase subunit HisH n=1 Tax=Caldalkalibacillus mannanilyticus TaxID=1418 RepID=UPI00046AABF5|nr:imidazole glycerol phosphate synthase subunit HisH [Caldalkalibacillus mannanilyticus]
MIAIIDYGMGNLHSVSQALERLGYDYVITDSKEQIELAAGVILPGVGAFGDAMKQLKETGLDQVIQEITTSGKPLLGICLGMQLLFESSEEGGEWEGLSLLKGKAKRLPGVNTQGEKYKVPHMGWNKLHYKQAAHPLLEGIEEGYTYFVHSFYMTGLDEEELIAYADYHERVPGVVGRNNVLGMQFHPEKSGQTGIQLLANFGKLCEGVKVG